MVFCLFSDKPPREVKGKGGKANMYGAMVDKQNNPNVWALPLKDAACKEPLACCVTMCGMPCGFSACYFRKAVLDKYHRGVEDFVCCQGYFPKICCVNPASCCQGSIVGLALEGCCFSMLSLSIARMHMMDSKAVQPDPMDYQIIAFSNCCQLLSCFCDILACIVPEFRDLAALIDCIADAITCTVAGCMGAQLKHELEKDGPTPGSAGPGAPAPMAMNRPGVAAPGAYGAAAPVTYATAQPVQPQQQFMVQVPPGSFPGQQIMVVAPSGQQMMVTVPQGVGPGMQFMCQA